MAVHIQRRKGQFTNVDTIVTSWWHQVSFWCQIQNPLNLALIQVKTTWNLPGVSKVTRKTYLAHQILKIVMPSLIIHSLMTKCQHAHIGTKMCLRDLEIKELMNLDQGNSIFKLPFQNWHIFINYSSFDDEVSTCSYWHLNVTQRLENQWTDYY